MVKPYTDDLTEALEDRDYLEFCLRYDLSHKNRERVREALREVDEAIEILTKEQAE